MDHSPVTSSVSLSPRWSTICGKFPKEEIIYFCQVLAIYVVVSVCLVKLCIGDGNRDSLWASLLSGSIGYLLPAPYIRKKKNDAFLLDAAGQ